MSEKFFPEIQANQKKVETENRETRDLNSERNEFLENLLLGQMDKFREGIAYAFMVDQRHMPTFLAGLVYSLDQEQLQELKEISSDYNIGNAFYVLKDFFSELKSIYQDGESNTETLLNSIDVSKKEANYNFEKNLTTYAELVRFFTGKEFETPDFLSEEFSATEFKDNPKLKEYIDYVDSFFDEFLKEKIKKNQDEFCDYFDEDIDVMLSRDFLKEIKTIPTVQSVFQKVIKKCDDRLLQFSQSMPLKEKKVFELGGYALVKSFKEGGAEAVNFDAEGFDWKKWGSTANATKVTNTMNLENYQSLLAQINPENKEQQYDLTASRMVFDDGSGIESTVPSGDYDEAAEEVLKVLASTTKKGAFSVNQVGFGQGIILKRNEEQKLEEFGFRKIFVLSGKDKKLYEKQKHIFFVRKRMAFLSKEEYNQGSALATATQPDFNLPTVVLERV